MGFKITALFLLGFLFISCSLLRAYSQDQIINKALQVDHPAASTTDDSFLPSFGKHKEFGSRKLLLEGEALTEKKVGRSSNDKGGAVKSPEASHVHASKTGSDDELTGASLNHKSSQNEGKQLASNEMNKSPTRVHIPPQMFGKPNFNVDYSGPQTHGPKHH